MAFAACCLLARSATALLSREKYIEIESYTARTRAAEAELQNSVDGTFGSAALRVLNAHFQTMSNFRRLVLGCIDSYDSEQRRIL